MTDPTQTELPDDSFFAQYTSAKSKIDLYPVYNEALQLEPLYIALDTARRELGSDMPHAKDAEKLQEAIVYVWKRTQSFFEEQKIDAAWGKKIVEEVGQLTKV